MGGAALRWCTLPRRAARISHGKSIVTENKYNTIQYDTIQYNTIQYNTIQYNTSKYTRHRWVQVKTVNISPPTSPPLLLFVVCVPQLNTLGVIQFICTLSYESETTSTFGWEDCVYGSFLVPRHVGSHTSTSEDFFLLLRRMKVVMLGACHG